jgi:DNA-binding PadR family transcriptional regulator
MLATRSWTGYELTQQVRRSLRFVWPTSEGHLYREQKKLVALGWATVEDEPVGRRTRQRYAITPAGRKALRTWLASPPEEPHLQVEGVLRAFYGNHTGPHELAASMRATAASARDMLGELRGFVDEYLAEDGPVALLEQGSGGPRTRQEFRGRELYPERLHAVALAIDVTARLLETVDDFFTAAAEEVADWPGTDDPALTPSTRARLEQIQARGVSAPGGGRPGPR